MSTQHPALPAHIDSALRQGRQSLSAAVDSPQLEAELLLAHVLGCTRTQLHAHPEQPLSTAQQQQFLSLLQRRQGGEPVAYLIGHREFWDLRLTVTPATLIPRPETERLVELALERIPQDAPWQIADLGTGSGAIALAIARARPAAHILATDLSITALAVARDNARQLEVHNVRFQHSHWFAGLGAEQFDLIVSNPPYIHPADPHLAQGDVRFEPATALQSGPDGLTDLRTIAAGARQHLHTGGWLLLEHGYDQGTAMARLLDGLGYHAVAVFTDLGGHERVCAGRWNPPR